MKLSTLNRYSLRLQSISELVSETVYFVVKIKLNFGNIVEIR